MKHGSISRQQPAPRRLHGDRLVTVSKLSELSGVSVIMIRHMVRRGMLPPAVVQDEEGTLFDLADAKLAAWVKALQDAGYNRR